MSSNWWNLATLRVLEIVFLPKWYYPHGIASPYEPHVGVDHMAITREGWITGRTLGDVSLPYEPQVGLAHIAGPRWWWITGRAPGRVESQDELQGGLNHGANPRWDWITGRTSGCASYRDNVSMSWCPYACPWRAFNGLLSKSRI